MCENLGAIEMLEYGIKLLDFVNTAMNVNLAKNSIFFDQMKYYPNGQRQFVTVDVNDVLNWLTIQLLKYLASQQVF